MPLPVEPVLGVGGIGIFGMRGRVGGTGDAETSPAVRARTDRTNEIIVERILAERGPERELLFGARFSLLAWTDCRELFIREWLSSSLSRRNIKSGLVP